MDIWPEAWMGKAYSFIWLSFTFLTLALMAGLYSRVVLALWFKRYDDNQLTHHQRVSIGYSVDNLLTNTSIKLKPLYSDNSR